MPVSASRRFSDLPFATPKASITVLAEVTNCMSSPSEINSHFRDNTPFRHPLGHSSPHLNLSPLHQSHFHRFPHPHRHAARHHHRRFQKRANNSLTLLKDIFKRRTTRKGKAEKSRKYKENAKKTK